MKRKVMFIAVAGVLAAGQALASGYRIPEQSINSVALSAAYVANAHGADASYFNPANMAWIEGGAEAEGGLTYINLTSIEYTDSNIASLSAGSRTEDFVMPTLHGVTQAFDKVRVGVSLVNPAGLSKRWDNPYQRASTEEFTLKVTELTPSVSYKINEKVAAAFGVRAIYATGVVKSTAVSPYVPSDLSGSPYLVTYLSRDMDGDTTEFGYNAALTVRPMENLSLATTYRSKVDLDLEGDATLRAVSTTPGVSGTYTGSAAVSVPLPEVWTLAVAYTMASTTVEFTYDRTKWSDYQTLDFSYGGALPGATSAFDAPIAKNWQDTNAFRLGVTQQLTDKLVLMGAIAIDENPVPDETLGFELPDSDALLLSIGARYRASDKIDVGLSYLYDKKDSRTVAQGADGNKINGTFDESAAHLLTAGMQFKF